eukprot:scaffold56.g4543.t1
MGTRLITALGKNLYEFWGSTIAAYLNQRQATQKQAVVINLASEEYFKSVDRRVLQARVVQCVFQDWKSGGWKVINFYAKRARGLMARYAIEQQVATPEGLQTFTSEGYAFDADVSVADKLVFRRKGAC